MPAGPEPKSSPTALRKAAVWETRSCVGARLPSCGACREKVSGTQRTSSRLSCAGGAERGPALSAERRGEARLAQSDAMSSVRRNKNVPAVPTCRVVPLLGLTSDSLDFPPSSGTQHTSWLATALLTPCRRQRACPLTKALTADQAAWRQPVTRVGANGSRGV